MCVRVLQRQQSHSAGLSVPFLGHFQADWEKLESKHRCFKTGAAVTDNHKHP